MVSSCQSDSVLLSFVFSADRLDNFSLGMLKYPFFGENPMYAIFQSGGKQYKVAPGDLVKVERLEAKVGDKVELNQVLLVQNEASLLVGKPVVEQAKILAEVNQQARSKKIIVFKKKRRKNYRKTQGHRQSFTQLKITEIITT
jgi:large subunit ribosomal protein L21